MKNSVSHLHAHMGYWLRHASNHVSSAFAQKLKQRNISVSEWVVLRVIYDTMPASPLSLSEATQITKGGISKILVKLEEHGWIERISCEDRRSHLIHLTTTGKKTVRQLAKLADQNDDDFFGHLSVTQHKQLMKLLKGLVNHHGWTDTPID